MSSDAARAMDRMYGWQSHIYDLTRKPYLLGRDQLIADLLPSGGGSVLEVGCGTARNLVHAARLYPDCTLFGIDVSSVMIAKARRAIQKAGMDQRISVHRSDAEGLRLDTNLSRTTYDRVFISYALSMIPAWREVLGSSFALVAPGGSLHVVDFGDGAALPAPFMAALNAWLKMFHVTPRRDLEEEFRRLEASAPGSRMTFQRLFGGYAFYAKLERPRG
jgi:S-adenosylmethionine-diacylgycerolhomoserine-N-methlytransferase